MSGVCGGNMIRMWRECHDMRIYSENNMERWPCNTQRAVEKYICRHSLNIQMSSHFHRTLCIAGSLSSVVFTIYSHVMTFPPHSNNIPATHTLCFRRTLWTVGSFPLLFSLYMRMTWHSRHIHVSGSHDIPVTHFMCHMSWRSDVSSLSHLMTFPPHSRVLIVPTHESWVVSHESWVMSHESWVMSHESWLMSHVSHLMTFHVSHSRVLIVPPRAL